jgi:D-psicose/D-tagatose/L-ribulose 3-epimerase
MTRFSFLILQPLPNLGSDDDVRRSFDLVKSCGYDGVELNLTPATFDYTARLERWLSESGLVLPSWCTGEAYGEGLCLSSPEVTVRRRAVQRLIEYLDAASQFGAILVVGMMQGLRSDELDSEVANGRIIEGLKEVGAAAEAKGVEFVLEPVNHLQVGFNNSVAEVLQLIQAIGSPAIKPMVDTVHMNIEEKSLTQPIYDCGSRLRHVHLCESNGGFFGTGRVDFPAVLQALSNIGYDGFGSVKVYRRATMEEAARTSIEALQRVMP